MKKTFIFVYGSLKQGFWNNHVLGDSEFVSGELYAVTDENVMRGLDRLEGVAHNHYRHLAVRLKGVTEDVLAYVAGDPEHAAAHRLCEEEGGVYQWQ